MGSAGGSPKPGRFGFVSQEEAFPFLLRHRQVREPAGAAGIPVPDHAGTAWPLGITAFPEFPSGSCSPRVPSPVQICVSKCPDRYMTYLTAYSNAAALEYYRDFCSPEFKNPHKVGARCQVLGAVLGVPTPWGDS